MLCAIFPIRSTKGNYFFFFSESLSETQTQEQSVIYLFTFLKYNTTKGLTFTSEKGIKSSLNIIFQTMNETLRQFCQCPSSQAKRVAHRQESYNTAPILFPM